MFAISRETYPRAIKKGEEAPALLIGIVFGVKEGYENFTEAAADLEP